MNGILGLHKWQFTLTNLLLVLWLNVAIYPYSNDEYPDSCKYFLGKSLNIEINNKSYFIYEAINEESNDRFIVIKHENSCQTNKNSLLSTEVRSGYATNYIKKSLNGFCYSFEYGNRYHYEYELYFRHIRGNFYLYKVVKKSSDLAKTNLKQKITTTPINNLSFDAFNINSYTQ